MAKLIVNIRTANFVQCTCVFALVIFLSACGQEPVEDELNTRDLSNVDWPVYLGDNGRQHYTPLSQIDSSNVASLGVAWRYDSGELRGQSSTMYTSPLVVNGVLYGLSPKLVAFALDAATGKELWRHDPKVTGAAQRGLMYWPKGDLIFFTAANELIALHAADGTVVSSFGNSGRLDLRPQDIERGFLGVTVPGIVFDDQLIFGFSTSEDEQALPGSIRSFSAVDGKQLWQFDAIPKLGDKGAETWAEGSLETAGGANAWTGMALDEVRGIVFVPTGSATPDFYGGNRLGDNLFANCLLALDAHSGELLWYFQMFRHDLWDRDNPSPPTLVQLEREGRIIDAVAVTTKSGQLFAFDRDTGESVYPIHEVATIPSLLPGEVAATSQPVSAISFSRQRFEITNRNAEAREFVEAQIADWDLRPWAPPKVGTVLIYPWYDGGAEWGGSAYDPATNRLILNANDGAGVLTLGEVPIGFSNAATYGQHCAACHGMDLAGTDQAPGLKGVIADQGYTKVIDSIKQGGGRMPAFDYLADVEMRGILTYMRTPEPVVDEPSTEVRYILSSGYVALKDHEDLPGNSGPWGTLNSIDLSTGDIVWKTPFGNYLSHPELDWGSFNYGGPVVSSSGLIFIAATPDKLFKIYDAADGSLLWQYELPAGGFSTPAVYSVDGVQYVVIAAGGGRLGPPSSSEYIAFKLLPDKT
ncbi:MAG: PQQ-binding-like beta-propeller repeat protein [Pseudomonadales bacterium]|nr:PQQ-binding-like beta-propeller repeat protein [Pseudomonadales bacterium]